MGFLMKAIWFNRALKSGNAEKAKRLYKEIQTQVKTESEIPSILDIFEALEDNQISIVDPIIKNKTDIPEKLQRQWEREDQEIALLRDE